MKRILTLIFACLSVLFVSPHIHAGTTQADHSPRYFIVGGYIAEIAVALDATEHIVGVSAGTGYIPELKSIPVIQGYRSLSAEAILALSPTVALLASRQTQPELITQLSNAGIEVHVFSDDTADINIVSQRIQRIGDILDKEAAANTLIANFEHELSDALTYVKQVNTSPRGLFILSGGGRPTVVAGGDTHIALLLSLAGAQNLTQNIRYFKPMTQEVMVEAAPEFILTNKEGLVKKGAVPVVLTAPGVRLTPAGRTQHIFSLPNGYLEGLGLLTPKAIKAIAQHIHPELRQ